MTTSEFSRRVTPGDRLAATSGVTKIVLRVVSALAGVSLSVACALTAARAGASRLLSDYAVRAAQQEAADLAVGLAPSDPEAHYARASAHADAGNLAGAIGSYERAVSLRPHDYVLRLELGKLRERAGDVEAALAAMREAVRLAPFYAQPRWQFGNALLRAGRREEAFVELRRAAEGDPFLYPNFVEIAWHASGGDVRFLFEAVPPRGPGESLALAKFLAKRGEPDEAVRLYRESGDSLGEAGRRELVTELISAGSFTEAYEVWSGGAGQEAARGKGTLSDGGFEGALRRDEAGFGWQFAREIPGVEISLDAAEPREGARSLRLDFRGNSAPTASLISQLILVEPGRRYRLGFAARARDLVTGGPLVVRVLEAEGAGDRAQLAASPPLPSETAAGWRDLAVEFAAPENAEAVRVVIQRQNCSGSPCPAFGHAWFDGFELRPIG